MRPLAEPLTMDTVNGETEATDETDIYVHSLNIFVTALVMNTDTAALLSVGNLATDHGIYFAWKDTGPSLTLPSGAVVECEQGCNVPMIMA